MDRDIMNRILLTSHKDLLGMYAYLCSLWRDGENYPLTSQKELCVKFGISQKTVSKYLDQLEKFGAKEYILCKNNQRLSRQNKNQDNGIINQAISNQKSADQKIMEHGDLKDESKEPCECQKLDSEQFYKNFGIDLSKIVSTTSGVLYRGSKNKNKNENKKKKMLKGVIPISSISPDGEQVAWCQIVNTWNNGIESPKVSIMTDKRQKAIENWLKVYTISHFESCVKKVKESDFLSGKNDKGWRATFDWCLTSDNCCKIIEGVYDNRTGYNPQKIIKTIKPKKVIFE